MKKAHPLSYGNKQHVRNIKSYVSRIENKGEQSIGREIMVSGDNLYTYKGKMTDPATGGIIPNAWELSKWGRPAIIVTREDVEVAMYEHGYYVNVRSNKR